MIRRLDRERSGITLTEILISIMIMGVGVVSLATLFPLGLLRLREAARLSRSGILGESAAGDLGARNLLSKASFTNMFTGPWYFSPVQYDPWIQDTPSYGANPYSGGAYRGQAPTGSGLPYQAGPGLPVAYDPLWRTTTGIYLGAATEARFGSGIGFVRPDPGGGDASAHGLPRLTNFPPPSTNFPSNLTGVVNDIFVSPEDIVLQPQSDPGSGTSDQSTVVPDLTLSTPTANGLRTPQYDWRYTWMFTGQQSDATNGAMFDGEIVVYENRPFTFDSNATIPFSHTAPVAGLVVGETVVEAVFGYTSNVTNTTGSAGYGGNSSRTVLLRWSDQVPDPDIKVGSWFADVTYERNATVDQKRSTTDPATGGATAFFPYQRCYWYQVAKRTPAGPGVPLAGDPGNVNYRQMVVWTAAPLRAFTLLSSSTGAPVHVNAALVSPFVVNVFSRTIYSR